MYPNQGYVDQDLALIKALDGILLSQVENLLHINATELILSNQDAWNLEMGADGEDLRVYYTGDLVKSKRFKWPPRDWQVAALQSWVNSDHMGIVEAMTGTGKTALGLFAINLALASNMRVVILVPTIDLMHQWYGQLIEAFPEYLIGKLGDGEKISLIGADILISTVQSAASQPEFVPRGIRALLVADECHRYGGEIFQLALSDRFEWRLGLSATYEGDLEYFQNITYRVSYEEALSSGAISPFRVIFKGVEFSPEEQSQYADLTQAIWRTSSDLARRLHCHPGQLYQRLKSPQLSMDIKRQGGFLYKKQAQQKELLSGGESKLIALAKMQEELSWLERVLLFSQTVDSANKAAEMLQGYNLLAASYHSKIPMAKRRTILQDFKSGRIQILCAPKILDEGIDVPESELGIVLSSAKAERQMIQRLGRIIRSSEGKTARLIIFYYRDSIEDPSLGGYKHFIQKVSPVASIEVE